MTHNRSLSLGLEPFQNRDKERFDPIELLLPSLCFEPLLQAVYKDGNWNEPKVKAFPDEKELDLLE